MGHLIILIVSLIATVIHILDSNEPKNKRKIDNDSR